MSSTFDSFWGVGALCNQEASDEFLESVSCCIQSTINMGFPPISGVEHLRQLLGRSEKFIIHAVYGVEKFYRSFKIPKKRGGFRDITAPYPSLLECQRWIYKSILSRIQLDDSVHGFIKGKSIKSNASVHLGASQILKIDLKDFFPSIGFERIIMVFRTAGYSDPVSFVLAKLCSYNGYLPQGAPTSPVLSNIIAMPMDYRLKKASYSLGLSYTRYADDLTFSGDIIPISFIRLVQRIVEDSGFRINQSKTCLYRHSSARKIVTGIVVNGNRLALPKEYRKELRKDLHFIMKYGMNSHMKERKIRRIDYYEHILGKVNFWISIEPENLFAQKARAYLVQHRDEYYGIVEGEP